MTLKTRRQLEHLRSKPCSRNCKKNWSDIRGDITSIKNQPAAKMTEGGKTAMFGNGAKAGK